MDEDVSSHILDFSQGAEMEDDLSGESRQLSSKELGISGPTQTKFSPVIERRFGKCKSCKSLKIEMKAQIAKTRKEERQERYDVEKNLNTTLENLRNEVKKLKESRSSLESMIEFLQQLYKKLELEHKELKNKYHRLLSEKSQIMKIYNS